MSRWVLRTGAAMLTLTAALASGGAVAQTSKADQARQQQAKILDSMGGAYPGPQADYVARVGAKVAEAAGMGGKCTFTLVNSDVVNAFAAPPGCYLYVTRGLLSVMNTEAELAGVLGHEVGHVTGKHSERQRNQQLLTGLAAILVGAVAGSDQIGQLASQAAQLGTLGYSRSQEYEADTLSVRYLPKAGYPTDGISRALASLQRQDEYSTRQAGAQAGKTIPVWARTHPLTGDRIQRAGKAAAKAPPVAGTPIIEGDYLATMDGMIYGDDPAQGFVRGPAFAHPVLKLAFDAPRGFVLNNGSSALGIQGPGGLRGEFSGGRLNGARLDAYASQVMQGLIGQTPAQVGQAQRTTIGGMEAVVLPARASSQNQLVDLTVVAYNFGGDAVYQFVTLAPAGQAASFDPLYASFRRLTDAEAARYQARRIQVVTVRSGDSQESLSARMATENAKLELFQMLNAVKPGQALAPGQRVKLVVEPRR